MQASLAAIPLKLNNAVPRYMDLKSEREFSVLHGNTEFSRTTFKASNPSNSNVNINCYPPGSDSLIHSIAWKKTKIILTIAITNASGGNINNILGAANPDLILRAFPLEQLVQTESLVMNSNTFTVSRQAEYSDCFHRFSNVVDDKVNEYSLTPSQTDEFYSYNLGTLTNKDPFAAYGGMQIGESRKAYVNIDYSTILAKTANDGATTNLTLTFTVMEPIKISPLYFQPYALTGIKEMTYTATFSNFERMVCLKAALAAGVSATISGNIDTYGLHFSYSRPKLMTNIPDRIMYPYQEIKYYSPDTVAVADDNEHPLHFNAIKLNAVPRRLTVWVSEKSSDILGTGGDTVVNLTKTDTAKSVITNISIDYNGRPCILGNANERDLYEISKKNGLLGLSYSQYSRWVGSYVAINFGEEIPLPESQAPGSLASPQLSFTVKFKRLPDSGDRTFQLNAAVIYEGTCAITKNSNAYPQLAVLIGEDVIDSVSSGYDIVNSSSYENNKYGGNPLALLGALSSALPVVRMIKGAVQKGAPIAKVIADGAEKIGLGVVVPEKKKRGPKGGRISGGQLINRSDLKDDLY